MNDHCKSGKKSYPTAQSSWRVITIQESQRWRATHKKRATPDGKAYRCEFYGQWLTTHQRKPP